MLRSRQLSTTSYPLNFLMVLSIDHITGATSKTVTVTLSKNGGGFNPALGAVTEIANGWYSLAGNATDRGTLGELLVHATATGCDPVDFVTNVVGGDPFDAVRLGLTALPNVAAAAVGGLAVLDTYSGVNGNLLDAGTLQSASVTGATLRAGSTGNFAGLMLEIYGGTGAGQAVPIVSQTGVVVTVDSWPNGTPNATSTYRVIVSGGASSGGVDVASFSGAAATQIDNIETHTDLIGTGILFTSVPVDSDGATTLVRGSSYYDADGLALTYTLSGYPALDVGTANAEWRALDENNQIVVVTGDTISATQLRFDVSAAVTQVLRTGHYSLQGVIDGSAHTLKTANDLLTVLDSI